MGNILIVDDDEDVLFAVGEMLRGQHTIFRASGGAEALKVMEAQPIHVLITDIRMPEIDGFDLIRKARELKPGLPTLALSAYFDESDAFDHQTVSRYADMILTKPVRREVLKSAVNSLIRG